MKFTHTILSSLCCLTLTLPCFTIALQNEVEIAYAKIEEANERLNVFNQELEWFIEFRNQGALELEKSLKENELWETRLLQDQELRIRLDYIRDLFKKFRENAARSISLPIDNDVRQTLMEATVFLDMTKWFTKYVEDTLFPQGWDESYRAYERKIAPPTPINNLQTSNNQK